MRVRNAHLSDRELVLAADSELSLDRERHLAGCPQCRARRLELEDAAVLLKVRRDSLPAAGPARTRLRLRLAEIAEQPTSLPFRPGPWLMAFAGGLALICVGAVLTFHQSRRAGALEVPSPRLTPGAARTVDREALCNSALPKNQVAPAGLRERVFQAYGIAHPDPGQYEVDYLITPALGGADDIRNLWPQPYVSTVWNARVKDELEDRLRELVCGGRLGLAEAQRDISTDWIAAYKKYFQTNQPVR
jgi:hypothetical protein